MAPTYAPPAYAPGAPAVPPAAATPSIPIPPPGAAAPDVPLLGPEGALALGESSITEPVSGTGYIDSAIIRSRLRLRYDTAYRNNFADRAEYFYAKCGCFANAALAGAQFDPSASGPPLPETSVDYQDIDLYGEYAIAERFSLFAEIPYRFLNPEQNANTDGWSDLKVGARYALIADCDQWLTFQFRTYIPTGVASRGLGTDHVSLEPALLYFQRLSERWLFDGEFRYWIPIDGTDFAGDVIRYGMGLSYVLLNSPSFRAIPVGEVVGWTVLDGRKSNAFGAFDADGDTIVNAKLGMRLGFGDLVGPGVSRSELYFGYGRALTGDVWYKDLIRAEWQVNF
jgi:hypothetical protein